MVKELMNTSFADMVIICGWWLMAFVVASNIVNLAGMAVTAAFKGVHTLYKDWQFNRAYERKKSTPEGRAEIERERREAIDRAEQMWLDEAGGLAE